MRLHEAIAKANHIFEREGQGRVTTCLDAGSHWIFYGEESDDAAIGAAGLKVEKSTGDMDDFILPDPDNFRLLDVAVPIELQEE